MHKLGTCSDNVVYHGVSGMNEHMSAGMCSDNVVYHGVSGMNEWMSAGTCVTFGSHYKKDLPTMSLGGQPLLLS